MTHTPEVIAASRMIRDDLYKRQTFLKRCIERYDGGKGRMWDANPGIRLPNITAQISDFRTVSGHLSPDTWRALFHCEHAWDRVIEMDFEEMATLDRILDDVRRSFTDELDPEMTHHAHQLPNK